MKTNLTILLYIFLPLISIAQRGLEAGAIIQPQIYSQIYTEEQADRAAKIPYSFAIGVDLGYNLTNNLGVRTGLLYTPIGERYNDLTPDPEERIDLNLNYVQLPFYLKFNSNPDNRLSLLVIAGANISFLNEALLTINDESPEGVLGDYKRIVPGAAGGIGVQLNLDRGGNINLLWRTGLSLDTVQTMGAASRNLSTGLQLSYHYFIWEPR